MLSLLVGLSMLQSEPIQRDDYGVPHIKAASMDEAFFHAGYAVAQDRLWQMENSRRVARGRMAEVFGPSFVASDREVLAFAYTDDELRAQVHYSTIHHRAQLGVYLRLNDIAVPSIYGPSADEGSL